MHIGKSNPKIKYKIFDHKSGNLVELESTHCERDLGVVVTSSGKQNGQVSTASNKANRLLGMCINTFDTYDQEIASVMYKTFIRPHLEFAVPVWNPYLIQDIKQLEKVQRRALRAIPGFRSLSYAERLEKMNLTTLQERRIRGDLIQVFKIQRGIDKVNWPCLRQVEVKKRELRSHDHQLRREITSNSLRHNFLMNRVASVWNRLPSEAINSRDVNEFKGHIDRADIRRMISMKSTKLT